MNILVFSDNPEQTNAQWRIVAPLAALRRKHKGINIQFETRSRCIWSQLSMSDVVLMHRPFTQAHLAIVNAAKLAGCMVWADWDDDLFHVPEDNPAHKHYLATAPTVKAIAEAVHVVTFSTEALALSFKAKCSMAKSYIAPNGMEDALIPEKVNRPEGNRGSIAWRGSQSHRLDLAEHATEIGKCSRIAPLVCFGLNPICEFHGEVWHYEYKGYPGFHEYLAILRQEAAAVQIVPLIDHPFNRAKSNIAWIEAMTAGSIVVAPKWKEWGNNACYAYGDGENMSLSECVESVFSIDKYDRANIAERGLQEVKDYYALSVTNRVREKILGL